MVAEEQGQLDLATAWSSRKSDLLFFKYHTDLDSNICAVKSLESRVCHEAVVNTH